MNGEKLRIIGSPAENGEYMLQNDIRDERDGTQTPVVSVYFRRAGEEDWEGWKSFPSWDEAVKGVEDEVAKKAGGKSCR